MRRSMVVSTLVLIVLVMGSILGSATAAAAELGDHLWKSRPLLLFAPAANDPRLVETMNRIEASRCDFTARDMVVGVVVAEGESTLDGQVVDAGEARRLRTQYATGDGVFTAVLIGKDGGEKWRVDGVPDLRTIYAVVDGMPMRNRESAADPSRC